MKKGKQIAQLIINKQSYSIRSTEHSELRMKQRNVDVYVVSSTILALGKERLLKYKESKKDIAIIDKENGIAVIAGFHKNTIYIITVIDKDDIWVKNDTSIVNIFKGEK